ncbi:MAG: L,D-transpeptidase [Hyphomicrobiales bacterium]|nr:L,D-transpeptidase [Hyphomicrobiales bacterium]MDE2116116.1 L,D-transpeptidase [Hyphomicrobiales bacterium]
MGKGCRGVQGACFRSLAALGFLFAAHDGAGAAVLRQVHFNVAPGQIVISQHLRTLFYVLPNDQAIAYRVAVPKAGKEWRGIAHVDAKYIRPAWSPPASVLRDIPNLPPVIAGGSPHNPMGVRALSLDRSEIAIHGTNRPASIGRAVSYGCIRMLNSDVRDLYQRVGVGTTVIMVP